MGWLTRILGGEPATPEAAESVDREAIIAAIRNGEHANIDQALEVMDDDDAFALLWDLLDNSAGMILKMLRSADRNPDKYKPNNTCSQRRPFS